MTNVALLLTAPALPTTPGRAVIMASVGIFLVFVELNRPGRILPGVLGFLLLLFAVAALIHIRVQPWAAALLIASAGIFLLNLWRALPTWLLVLVTLLTIAGLRFLVPPTSGKNIQMPLAILCGGALGGLTAVLTRLAYRARRSKALD